jgi:predicted transglutaminase-like cysteine proteinase
MNSKSKNFTPRWIFFLCIFPILSLFIQGLKPSPLFAWEPPSVSEKVFQYIKGEYGAEAEKRMRYLNGLVHDNYQLPIAKKLTLVNRTMNKLPWIADPVHWKQADYWATPIETISTFGGDCEDIAIAKWIVLNMMGVTNDHLRLAYVVVKKTGEKHMILLYLANPKMPPDKWDVMILDNLDPEVKAASKRHDLIAVFVTDADGNVVLVADDGKQRKIKGVYENRTMRKLDDLKKIIRENRLKIKELNDGKALWPENP